MRLTLHRQSFDVIFCKPCLEHIPDDTPKQNECTDIKNQEDGGFSNPSRPAEQTPTEDNRITDKKETGQKYLTIRSSPLYTEGL